MTEEEAIKYQSDRDLPEYNPDCEDMTVTLDEVDVYMRRIAFIKKQLAKFLLDDYGFINYEDTPKDLIDQEYYQVLKPNKQIETDNPNDYIPMIRYQNEEYAYYMSSETNVINKNVPISWNANRIWCKYNRCGLIGELIIPKDVLDFVKETKAKGQNDGFTEANICRNEKLYENAKEFVEAMIKADDRLNGHPVLALVGALWCESGWQLEHIVNALEAGGGGVSGTGGMTGAGESWFGLTFWNQKKQIIDALNLNCGKTEATYTKGNMICDLPIEEQARVWAYYLETMVPKPGKVILEFNEGDQTEEDAKQVLGAAFVFKAGNWKNSGDMWEDALDARQKYLNTHKKQNGHAHDGLALAIYMSMMFVKYLENEEVPEGDPWDE